MTELTPEVTQNSSSTTDMFDLVLSGDWVLQAAFLCLVLMSVLSWATILYRLIVAIRVERALKRHAAVFQHSDAKDLDDALTQMNGVSPLKTMIEEALKAKREYFGQQNTLLTRTMRFSDYLERAIRYGLDQTLHHMDGGLTLLATIGATAPFVGLFGTVWGIYHALINISLLGSINIATIAGPIGEALIATAVGLFVAIPAVLAYNLFLRRNRVLSRDLDALAHDLYRASLNTASED